LQNRKAPERKEKARNIPSPRLAARSSADWDAVFDTIGDTVLILDPETCVIHYANRNASETYGRTTGELLGLTWGELCSTGEAHEANRRMKAAAKAGSVFEQLTGSREGGSFWIEVDARLTLTGKGRFIIATIRDVTYRKEIERELAATKDYLNAIFNNIHDAVFIHDIDGKVLDVNDKLLDMYRLTREEAIGLNIMADYTTPEGRPDLRALWRGVIKGHSSFVECRGRRPKDGFEFDVEVFLTRLPLPGSDYVLATVREITARKRAERELAVTKDYLNAVFNSIHDAVFVHDIDGKVLDVNDKLLDMYRLTREEAIGLNIMADYTTPEGRPDLRALWRGVIKGHSSFVECRGRRPKDGFEFDVEVFLNRLRLPNGDSILATIRDISERKRVERELLATKNYLNTVFNSIHDAVFVHDLKGRVVDVNNKLLDMYRLTREEAIGLSIEPDYITPEGRPDLPTIWAEVMTGHDALVQCRGRRPKDGFEFDAETFLTRLSLPGGDYILANTHDITKRKLTERRLDEEQQRLKAVYESSPVGMAVMGGDGKFRFEYLNPKFKELFECDIKNTPDMNTWLVRAYPDLATRREAASKWMGILHSMTNGSDVSFVRKLRNNGRSWKYIKFVPVGLPTGEILMTCWDITKNRQAEQRIRERNLVLEVLNEVMSSLTASLDLFEILHALERVFVKKLKIGSGGIFFGGSSDSKKGEAVCWGIPDDRRDDFETFALTCYREGRVVCDNEITLVRHKVSEWSPPAESAFGEQRWRGYLCISLFPKGETQGMIFLADGKRDAFRDDQIAFYKTLGQQIGVAIQNARLFGEVRQSHAEMKALSLRLVHVQEEELRHVGRELHDEIGQLLTGLGLTLEMALQTTEVSASSLMKAKTLADTITGLVRELSRRLRPSMLDDLGLFPTLPWLFERFSSHMGIQVIFEHMIAHKKRFDREIETAVYRIIQEALTNVARHAKTDRATVRLWSSDSALGVQIEDDGIGFDAPSVGNVNGLNGMRERAMLLGGRFVIDTCVGGGTRLTAEFPMKTGSDKP
jgi:PAS domain S-box-containing protein